jgi:hypothetical protein
MCAGCMHPTTFIERIDPPDAALPVLLTTAVVVLLVRPIATNHRRTQFVSQTKRTADATPLDCISDCIYSTSSHLIVKTALAFNQPWGIGNDVTRIGAPRCKGVVFCCVLRCLLGQGIGMSARAERPCRRARRRPTRRHGKRVSSALGAQAEMLSPTGLKLSDRHEVLNTLNP